MAILYDEKEKVFHLQTEKVSYVMGVLAEKHLLHLYYGKKVEKFPFCMRNLPVLPEGNWLGIDLTEIGYSSDALPMEYPCYGSADYRMPAFHAEYEDGSAVTKLEYCGYQILSGKKPLKGLPASYTEEEKEAQTLEITLEDKQKGLAVILSYTVFESYDVITKSVHVQNGGKEKILLKSVFSSAIHLFDKKYEFIHLHGYWSRERHVQKSPLINGVMSIDSKKIASSHQHSPFLALARTDTTENQGEAYAHSLVYSGNHLEMAEVNAFDTVRVIQGINPFGFSWMLEPEEEFQTPESVLVYSSEGLGRMSRIYHRFYRERLCRGYYRDRERPVLINNWEATYFDFNETKILEIAKKAKEVGVDLVVLDDGWFGKRNTDKCSLGDWYVNREKLPNGIDGLAKKIRELGMEFGLWFEPEMVSEDSDLYREHPDWCIHIKGREKTLCRHQLVLDLSRKDVCDYIVQAVSDVLNSADISYVKWDMNRNITEIGSSVLLAQRQQELPHRYMLGLYDVLERLTKRFPKVLFEGCSGGGGRFDAGMLPYFPQYWTSDDTDAKERLFIQHGTSMVMPSCTMGAHVSAVPNHQVHRTTPLQMRGHVAMQGQLGYELDLNRLTYQELETVREQICTYKKIRNTVHHGEMYRLKSPFEGICTAWEHVSKDKKEAVLFYCTISASVMSGRTCVKLQGLLENREYQIEGTNMIYRGDYLMNVGLYFENNRDYESKLLYLKCCEKSEKGDV